VKRSTIFYLTASAIVAYFYGFPTNGLSHFDEGQYAFARVWPWIDTFDVDQAFFSPPLYPFLVGLVQHLPISRPDLAGVYISHIACWLSLYFAVRLAAAWWGDDAALPTFALLLFSPMRLAFGSIGLTDALFSALFLATLLAATKAFHDGSTKWVLLAGLLAGSTWSCKYNGFIAVAVCAGFFLHQRSAGSLLRWLTIAFIAAAVMIPWYWAFHAHHPEGIAALQKHQQGYLRGFAPETVWSDLQRGFELRSDVPGMSVFLACWVMLGFAAFAKRAWLSLIIVALLLAAEECCASNLLPLLALGVLPLAVVVARASARIPIVLAVGGTVFLPAIYTPYLRLWLPGEHVLLIVLAGAVGWTGTTVGSIKVRRPVVALASLLLLVPSYIKVGNQLHDMLKLDPPQIIAKARMSLNRARLPMPSVDGYKVATKGLVDETNMNELRELLIYARPPLLYYLVHANMKTTIRRLPDERIRLDQLPFESMIVADIGIRDSKKVSESLSEGKRTRTLQPISHWRVVPHPLTMMDDFGRYAPWDASEYKLHLYLTAPWAEAKP